MQSLSAFKQWGCGPTEKSDIESNGKYEFTKYLPLVFKGPIFACVKDKGDGTVPVSGQVQNTIVKAYAKEQYLYWDYLAIGF